MKRRKSHAEQFEFSFSQDTAGNVLETYVPNAYMWRITYSDGTTERITWSYTTCTRSPQEMLFEFECRYPGTKASRAEFLGKTK